MGVASVVQFHYGIGNRSECICSIHQHNYGHLDGVGLQLAHFLNDITIVNGCGKDTKLFTHANGIGCLAAQYIAGSKVSVGDLYMTVEDNSQDYNYDVYQTKEGNLVMCASGPNGDVYEGSAEGFIHFCETYEERDDEDQEEDIYQ